MANKYSALAFGIAFFACAAFAGTNTNTDPANPRAN
jgi:hypothetical protein